MIKVFIDDIPCVADATQSISIDYHSKDLSDVESGREGAHIVLRLPSTTQNDSLFGNAADIESAESFNAEYHEAYIEADGAEIFRGTAYLVGVEMEGEATWYKIEIIGGASQWAKQAGRQMFNLIGIDYSARLDMTEICNSWESDSPVKFLPVQRDQYELENGVTSFYTPEKILTTDDYHPFLSVAALLGAIFEQAGYRVESRFFESELFRSLYISGAYSSTDASARFEKMGFLAGRLDSVTASANYAGRVYASPSVAANSLGNIVDTVAEEVVDSAGNTLSTGFYSRGGCFAFDDKGVITFTPLTAVNVGFEYSLKFACDYRIASRSSLFSFSELYLEEGISIPFMLSNRFKDHRESLLPGFEYRLVMFDYLSDCNYRLRYKLDGVWQDWIDVTSQTMLVRTPTSAQTVGGVELVRAEAESDIYESCLEDWALYGGYVEYEGVTEVEMTVRTPAVELSPSSPKRFDSIYFGGGEPGMEITLLAGTTLRPLFTSTTGYGSHIEFADVAQHQVRQSVLLDAVRHMFNLRFYTDEREKRVYIEPYDDFLRRDEVFDWSSRVDFSRPIVIEEQARGVHERRTLGYDDDDGTVRRFNAEAAAPFGEWSFDVASRVAVEGEQQLRNPLFASTINLAGKYANAESALIMQVSNRDENVDDVANFSPRIVRYVGTHPLSGEERWGFPYCEGNYPLAAFHFAGDSRREGFTLCFEDRDGVRGLHSYYDRMFAEEAECRRVSVSIRISPEEFEHLFHFVDGAPSIRSIFELRLNGVTARYSLYAIEGYDPSKSSVRCLFSQISPRYE